MSSTDFANISDDQLQEVVQQFLNKGQTLRVLKGLSSEEMEAVYTVAYNYFQNGRYDEAEKMFRFLCFFDHLSQKYWLGLGACRKAKRDFARAIDAFGLAGILDLHDPRAAIQSAECHIQLGDRDKALSALRAIVEFTSEDSPHAAIRKRAELMLDVLQKGGAA